MGLTVNRQIAKKYPSTVKNGIFLPSNEGAKISRQISQISLNDRDRLTKCGSPIGGAGD